MAGARRWHQDEIDFLTKNYGVLDAKEISDKIKRSVDAIHWKASSLDIRHRKEDVIFYEKLESILKRIDALEERVESLTLFIETTTRVGLRWTNEEELFIKENYNKMKVQEISKKLKRSIESIYAKVGRMEDVNPISIRNPLSESEKKYIIENYKIISINKIVSNLGVDRNKVYSFLHKKNIKINKNTVGYK